MIDRIVPADAIAVEATDETTLGLDSLSPDELAAVATAVPHRQREMIAGRDCARRALARLGMDVPSIPPDADRVPCWPHGVVGSITHAPGYVAAIVAHARDHAGLGIDAERIDRVAANLAHLIAVPDELAWIATRPDPAAARALVFSAKEAAYKSQFPTTRERLDFLDARVLVDGDAFTITWRAGTRAAALPPIEGRIALGATHVVTVARWR